MGGCCRGGLVAYRVIQIICADSLAGVFMENLFVPVAISCLLAVASCIEPPDWMERECFSLTAIVYFAHFPILGVFYKFFKARLLEFESLRPFIYILCWGVSILFFFAVFWRLRKNCPRLFSVLNGSRK